MISLGGTAAGAPLIGGPAADAMLNLLEEMPQQVVLETCSLLQEKGTKAPFCVTVKVLGRCCFHQCKGDSSLWVGRVGKCFHCRQL